MTFKSEYVPLPLSELHGCAERMKAEGYRFIQTHAVHVDGGTDLYYSFMKDGAVTNYRVECVKPDEPVPSITDVFLAAFVFENEARELFGVDMRDIAIDFDGAMYAPAESEPMTFISPEMKEAKEKARKAAAAKAAKAAKEAKEAAEAPKADGASANAALEAKLAAMDPEKAAKVRAAMEAKAARAAKAAEGEEN